MKLMAEIKTVVNLPAVGEAITLRVEPEEMCKKLKPYNKKIYLVPYDDEQAKDDILSMNIQQYKQKHLYDLLYIGYISDYINNHQIVIEVDPESDLFLYLSKLVNIELEVYVKTTQYIKNMPLTIDKIIAVGIPCISISKLCKITGEIGSLASVSNRKE